MKTLMLRQIRQLAAPALVSVALGILTYLGLSLGDGLPMLSSSPAEVALALVGIVAPWLVAVAAIAPDAESGGMAFLGGLPLARGRHFAVRTLVAAGSPSTTSTPAPGPWSRSRRARGRCGASTRRSLPTSAR